MISSSSSTSKSLEPSNKIYDNYYYNNYGSKSNSDTSDTVFPSSQKFENWIREFRPNTARYNDVCSEYDNDSSEQQQQSKQSSLKHKSFDDVDQAHVHLTNYTIMIDNHDDVESIEIDNLNEQIYLYQAYGRLKNKVSKNSQNDWKWLRNIFNGYQDYQTDSNNNYNKLPSIVIITIVDRLRYCPDSPNDPTKWPTKPLLSSPLSNVFDCIFRPPKQHPFLANNTNKTLLRSNGKLSCIPEHHGQKYTAAIITCDIPVSTLKTSTLIYPNDLPQSVKVITIESGQTTDWLPINYDFLHHYQQNKQKDKVSSVICVRALFGTINILNVLEFISYYHLNGFDRIVFYYYNNIENNNKMYTDYETSSSSEKTDRFIKLLKSLPGVHLKLFELPRSFSNKIHAGGQLVTINDCLYQYPNAVQLHVDIDEFVFIGQHYKKPEQAVNKPSIHYQPDRIMDFIIDHWYWKSISYVALYLSHVLHCHEFNLASSSYYEFNISKCSYHQWKKESILLKSSVNYDDDENDCNQNLNNRTWLMNVFKSNNTQTIMTTLKQSTLLVPNSRYCQKNVWPSKHRSKVILLRPWLVRQLGVHQVWMFEDNDIDDNLAHINKGKIYSDKTNSYLEMIQNLMPSFLINSNISPLLSKFFTYRWSNLAYENNLITNPNYHIKQWPEILFDYDYIDSNQMVLRHFRWCCGLKQPYLLDLLYFNVVDDQIIECFPSEQIFLPFTTNNHHQHFNYYWSNITQDVFKYYTRFLFDH